MEQPVFPEEFVLNHCPKTLEARHWRKVYKVEGTDKDDTAFAECAFKTAGGCGFECENCDEFLAGTGRLYPDEEKFVPLIAEYYDKLKKYEKHCIQEDRIKISCGEGI